MAAYLKCRVTGDVIGPCWADRYVTENAAGSSELLDVVTDWTTNHIPFDKRRGWGAPIVERAWDRIAQQQLNDQIASYRALVATPAAGRSPTTRTPSADR
jgi:hypothetical protein